MSVVVLLAAVQAGAAIPCGTAERLLQGGLPETPGPAVAATGGKLARDGYGVPNALETRNFVVRWGNEGAVDPADVDALARALEDVWRVEVDELAYPQPLTTLWYKLNVYIGDTGGGAPESGDAAGYYWYDGELYPMLVLSALAVGDPDYAQAVAAHEFFHGVQAAAATYLFSEVDFWYWEATATWITSQVFPGNPHYASLLFGQAFVPEQSIHGYFYGSGGVLEFQPYGAFVFVTWLSEIGGAPDLVRRSWVDAPRGGAPIDVIERLLEEEGWTLSEAFFDFARRNATWDYADGPTFTDSIVASGGWGSPDARRPSGTITGETGGWLTATDHLPHTLGANYWSVQEPPEEAVVGFQGDGGAEWYAALAGIRDGEAVHVEVPLVDGTGSVEVSGLPAWSEAWLVVAAFDGKADAGPVGGYALELRDVTPSPEATDTASPEEATAPEEPVPVEPVPDEVAPDGKPRSGGRQGRGGCGCGGGPPVGWGALWLGLAAFGLRRQSPVYGGSRPA